MQGVGFSHHVKNLDDGTVEIACEGSQGDIDALLERMRSMKPPVALEDVSVLGRRGLENSR